jgi:hypothetical protein
VEELHEAGFPYVEPPPLWAGSLHVEQIPGTRIWKDYGSQNDFRQWMREAHEAFPGDLIPLQWVPGYVGVSRPAVKKRVDAGNLTCFRFTPVRRERTILGREVYREERTSYEYAIRSECDAWRDILLVRAGVITEEERIQELRKRANERG